jgi:hypothetical protein
MRQANSVTSSPIVGSPASNSRRQAVQVQGDHRARWRSPPDNSCGYNLKPAGSGPNGICTISSNARARAHGLSQAVFGIIIFAGQDAAELRRWFSCEIDIRHILTSPRKSYSFLRSSGSCQWQCPTGSSAVRMKKELTTRGPSVPTARLGWRPLDWRNSFVACDPELRMRQGRVGASCER